MGFEEELSATLKNCDKDQLNLYLNDEESFEVLVKSLSGYQELVTEKENLQQLNKSIAESNLGREPTLREYRLKLEEALRTFEEAKAEYLAVKQGYEAQQSVNGDMSLEGILTQLQMSATKAEDESGMNADDFFTKLNASYSEEEVNNFQRKFLEERTQAHIKRIKADKLKEILPSYLMS